VTSKLLTIINGDALEELRKLSDESVQCCVTSPPYWGLRDYCHADQIGQEATPELFVQTMVEVFREVRRVLKTDGTLWLNLGDSYAGAGYSNHKNTGGALRSDGGVQKHCIGSGLPNKNLIGIPWRVALALQADGWWLRSDIIWAKTSVMPESVTDRPTKAHEHIFLLTKSKEYHYDHEAIKEPCAASSAERAAYGWNGTMVFTDGKEIRSQPDPVEQMGERWCPELRNKRDVWTVAPAKYPEAHFATYPPALIQPCILAGTKPGDVVLDPFGGSGTTGQVALELGRHAILIELNPDYEKLIKKRTNTTPGLALA
jgi:DNA modification methylase